MELDEKKARRGLTKFLARKGGRMPIGQLALRSTIKYGAAHKAFSDLMEGLVDDGYVEFEDGEFAITDAGRAWIEKPAS